MSPLPRANKPEVCELCGRRIHPLLFRYFWLAGGWRGRPSPKPHKTTRVVFCGPCADRVLELLAPLLPFAARQELER